MMTMMMMYVKCFVLHVFMVSLVSGYTDHHPFFPKPPNVFSEQFDDHEEPKHNQDILPVPMDSQTISVRRMSRADNADDLAQPVDDDKPDVVDFVHFFRPFFSSSNFPGQNEDDVIEKEVERNIELVRRAKNNLKNYPIIIRYPNEEPPLTNETLSVPLPITTTARPYGGESPLSVATSRAPPQAVRTSSAKPFYRERTPPTSFLATNPFAENFNEPFIGELDPVRGSIFGNRVGPEPGRNVDTRTRGDGKRRRRRLRRIVKPVAKTEANPGLGLKAPNDNVEDNDDDNDHDKTEDEARGRAIKDFPTNYHDHGRVKMRIFRGPSIKDKSGYGKYFAPWGYSIKMPVESSYFSKKY